MDLEKEVRKILKQGSRYLNQGEIDKITAELMKVFGKYISSEKVQKPF